MQDWFVFNMVSCLSVAPAAILGVVNCRTVATRFMPFVVITWFGLLNELVSLYYIFQINSNAVNSNIYVLVEFLLFLWLFNRWQQGYYKRWFLILVGFGFLVWLTDNLLMNTLDRFNSGFRVFYAFIIVVCSIQKVNQIISHESSVLVRHAQFWLCMVFVMFYSVKAFLEVFYLFEIGASNTFFTNLFFVMQIVNLFTNIIFATVYLWIPKKQEFLLHY